MKNKPHPKARPGNQNGRKEPASRKSTQIVLRVTGDEKSTLTTAAHPHPLSRYIRRRLGLTPHTPQTPPPSDA